MKTNQNNRTIASALSSACAGQFLTVGGFIKSLPKASHAPQKAAMPKADAMASLVTQASKPAKEPNYPPEVSAALLADWAASTKDKDATEKLAEKFGKTTRSIVAKLSREGVYKKAEYKTKAGTVPVSKEAHVATIAAFVGKRPDELESLEKANKGVLVTLEDALKKSAHDYDNATSDDAETKASKTASIEIISAATGATIEELTSLKLAKRETLQIIAQAFADEADAAVYANLKTYADSEATTDDEIIA